MDSEKCVSVCACLPAQKQTRCHTVCLKGAKKKKKNPKNRQALDSNHDDQSSCVCKPADAASQFSSWTQHDSVEA